MLRSPLIKSFRHKGLKRFYESGSSSGIQPHHAKRLRTLFAALETATSIDDMDIRLQAPSVERRRPRPLVDLGE